jgi:gamma-glutamylcyclotransferase
MEIPQFKIPQFKNTNNKTNAKRVLYFAYGSNLEASQMTDRCPSSRALAVATLKGYRLDFTRFSACRRGGVADIVPASGARVQGLIYELSPQDLRRLDRIEGTPDFYRRVTCEVESASAEVYRVWVYEVVNKCGHVPPHRDYLALLLTAAQHLGFDRDYREFLRDFSIAAGPGLVPDPDS